MFGKGRQVGRWLWQSGARHREGSLRMTGDGMDVSRKWRLRQEL